VRFLEFMADLHEGVGVKTKLLEIEKVKGF
jgi:hypothetical protein